jgi:hypothetical protein
MAGVHSGHRYERRRQFSNFELFLVDATEAVKTPQAAPNSESPKK